LTTQVGKFSKTLRLFRLMKMLRVARLKRIVGRWASLVAAIMMP
jgi:hypothetical protein